MTTYLDLNVKYSPKNIKTAPVMSNVEAIKENLLRLLTTPIGSVPFNREYGSHLFELVFDNNINLHDIRILLTRDIRAQEPRVNISPMDISLTRIDEHTCQVSCIFTIPSLGDIAGEVTTSISDQN